MAQDFLSDTELYFTDKPVIGTDIIIEGEECHHLADVMRHKTGDEIYVSDGKGRIYSSLISSVGKKRISAAVIRSEFYENQFPNLWFCIPRLKSADRFEFALEKCVELGITNFIVFDSKRTVAKGEKIERWEKILTAAMKQSLRAWFPKISYVKEISEIYKLKGKKLLFDQNAKLTFRQYLSAGNRILDTDHYFIFGPEGGFTEEELGLSEKGERPDTDLQICLTKNRLRSETAIVTAAAMLSAGLL